jgi:hypothetical protein
MTGVFIMWMPIMKMTLLYGAIRRFYRFGGK